MKRALPVLVLSIAGLVPVWLYEPSLGITSSEASTPSVSSSTSSSGSSGTSSGVVTGTTVTTEKGDVQVEVTFAGSKISSVRMLKQPNHPQTTAAVPVLIKETLAAQSADIDTVSGATITSDGYRESLQAAIDSQADSAASSPSPSTSTSAPAAESASKVVSGTAVDTEKGTVQVEVTFEGDKIASVKMLQQPNHPQTTAAVPVLISETLAAQSADIDTVSGATITSDGYRESLQAAIDAKG
ncbi:FMN-binding protein [Streptomyces turgidiscabies]|uniref:FMN-binding domain protein n=1 Tax=Streptomyces turgidiscabies (strain Car8) TaxID=698760 RepID=L7FIH7_STRT8|nr:MULTISPECIES: FMN-binding protein [Streptomyces]ELP70989.1 FMN-binding domain protein [Streptomyces turgidiscabies Car8]MDX3491884.1 FMN-binding protein [Streptomyces turgidiscabies]GAQ71999.1 Na(+)-translocating NADH-quinone reductase [Streptomyces turgidiscabies]